MASAVDIALLPDAGPLITLAYADALDVLSSPGWSVMLVDIVLHEVTRSQTPTSEKIAAWVASTQIPILPTRTFQRFRQAQVDKVVPMKRNLGELAIQETMNEFALMSPPKTGIFLCEDHKIARVSFLVPDNCRKISTRAFLIYLEQKGRVASAAEIERRARRAGRTFSTMRYPTS